MSKNAKLRKKRLERQEERKVSSCWNISCLVHSKNFNTDPPKKSTKQNPLRQNEKKSVWNLFQWQEFWIHLTKFDATTRKLNRQYDIQRVKISMIRCHKMWCGTTKTRFLASIPLLTLLFLCYLTVSRMTLIWNFRCGWVLQKVDINLLVLLEAF